jgi:uncharacterized damage-inducible protein DinB
VYQNQNIMTFTESFLNELKQEAVTTRKMLERVPADLFHWQPHQKSMTLKQLATHVAELPTWINLVIKTKELDFEANPYQPVPLSTEQELLTYFEQSLTEGQQALANATDEQLTDRWVLRSGETIYSNELKRDFLRQCFCQVVHHRAQLGVYLRLLDIPIPGSYGPSADEQNFN